MTFPDLDFLYRAWKAARTAHHGQTRRDGVTPYMNHIDAVVLRGPKDAIHKAVRLLHDTVESDCAHPLTLAEIERDFGPEVADGVDTLTIRAGESYEAFIQRVKTHNGGKWVSDKVADILANLSDSPTPRQITKYARALLALVDAP